MVCNVAAEFEVAICYLAHWVFEGNKLFLHCVAKGVSPQYGSGPLRNRPEEHATHACARHVASAIGSGCAQAYFSDLCCLQRKVCHQPAKIV